MTKRSSLHFQLSGGGLAELWQQRLAQGTARRLSIRTRIILAFAVLWLPPALLSLAAGTFVGDAVKQPFITDILLQVRLLLALPLLLVAERTIDPAVDLLVRDLDQSGVIADADEPKYRATLSTLEKLRDSVTVDVLLLLAALSVSLLTQAHHVMSTNQTELSSALWSISDGELSWTPAGTWYVLVSAPIFRFVVFRWAWRFLIWAGFLYRVSRLELKLQPTHPDLSGGLGLVGFAQQTFAIIFVAISTTVSASIAKSILFEEATFRSARPEMFLFVLAFALVIHAPLLFFAKPMYEARRDALGKYGTLGQRLSQAFFDKWSKVPAASVGPELKSTGDASAMADYGATFAAIEEMRIIPLPRKGAVRLVAALIVPFMPLYFTEFSISDLMERLSHVLI